MRSLKEHSSLIAAVVLFVAALVAVFPFCRYYVDPDATACLTVARRYAAGDYAKAVNGYWSPWGIWLTALLIKAGATSFKAAIIVNAMAAAGFLWISHSFFRLFRLRADARWILSFTLSLFLVYAVFWQSFDDLWECFFLLVILRLLIRDEFGKRPVLWVLTGVFGALAYFSKAYAFPFFILEVICCGYFITGASRKENRLQWLKMIAVCLGTMLLVSAPWLFLLHEKYGRWMTGTAGSLNTSWYLVGHPYWKEGILHLLPPVYADSPSYWEDPYMANGAAPHFWDTPRLFLLQLVRAGYNLLKFVQSINELSPFFAVTVLITLVVLFSRKVRERFDSRLFLVSLSFLLFPLGYVLVNFQGRYLWYMFPLGMLAGAVTLTNSGLPDYISRFMQRTILVLFAASFLAYPALGLKEMYRAGQAEFETARILQAHGLHGSFTTNIPYGERTQHIVRLAYFSGNPYYNMPLPALKEDLLKEMRRYRVKYYFHFYEGLWDDFTFTDEQGRAFPQVTPGGLKGLKVFLVTGTGALPPSR